MPLSNERIRKENGEKHKTENEKNYTLIGRGFHLLASEIDKCIRLDMISLILEAGNSISIQL